MVVNLIVIVGLRLADTNLKPMLLAKMVGNPTN
jgi:hypothetical protein